jgi:hypothetical protein
MVENEDSSILESIHDLDDFLQDAKRLFLVFEDSSPLEFGRFFMENWIESLFLGFSTFVFLEEPAEFCLAKCQEFRDLGIEWIFRDLVLFLLQPNRDSVELFIQPYKKPKKKVKEDPWKDKKLIECSGCKSKTPEDYGFCVFCGHSFKD